MGWNPASGSEEGVQRSDSVRMDVEFYERFHKFHLVRGRDRTLATV